MNDTEQLRHLQKVWYKKLEEEGFADIEFSEYSSYLKRESLNITLSYDEPTERYYTLARQYLNDTKFVTPTEKRVWELHSEGLSYDKILGHISLWSSRSPIQRIVLKHKKILLTKVKDGYV